MKTFFALTSAALGFAGLAQAHMEMIYPAPFKSKANPYAGSDIDYSMTAPLSAGGDNFPCKGYHSLFGTDAGKPTASWNAGETYNMTITGGANHGGGSCQASLSFDKGATWTVIHSYVGNCPAVGTSSLDFTLPADAPSGEAIFAWSWFNKIGNREMYMNCAAININGGGSSKKRAAAMSSRPGMFTANINNGCTTKEGTDLAFPNPGPDTDDDSSNTSPPVGSCAAGGGGGSGGGSGDDSGDDSGSAPTSAAPEAPPATTEPVAPSTPAGGASTTVPGGVFITVSEPAEGTEAPAAPTTVPENNEPVTESSTLITITRSAGGGDATEAPAAPTTTATPVSPPEDDTGSEPGNGDESGGGALQTPGTPCKQEGLWNCIGGTKFQRCASGQWSQTIAVAPGTSCKAGYTTVFEHSFSNSARIARRN